MGKLNILPTGRNSKSNASRNVFDIQPSTVFTGIDNILDVLPQIETSGTENTKKKDTINVYSQQNTNFGEN